MFSQSESATVHGSINIVDSNETSVIEIPGRMGSTDKTRPAHHVDDSKTRFRNPWPSFRLQTPRQWASFAVNSLLHSPKIPKDLFTQIPSQTPTWGLGLDGTAIKATWLGHACYFVELPTPEGASRGPRIVFDPALSHRCSPVPWIGPTRLLSTACQTTELPVVDVVVLSHNHYDHTDSATLRTITQMHHPHVFAPLGNLPYLSSLGIPRSHIHILDWWDARLVSIPLPVLCSSTSLTSESSQPTQPPVTASIKVTCTPCQHTANRTPFDRWHTLWASWAVEEADSPPPRPAKKVYFAGDTGYRTVFSGEDENAAPACPAFTEIGEHFDGFDLALLPIGAYAPRSMWSNLHASPGDSVRIFKDVRAKKALAMHWGTWILTAEPIMEPPQLLKEECAKAGLKDGDFDICALGETRII
ncbi:hypothetical protein AcW1_003351 [Taiwanofungus camphoratus]|nr:hypothetical protein AcV5_002183 [Antrodia cinnamomea]KAI0941468.1 hypothetical protein AcW1_003351 [Antrodia cinnamomea]KAI0944034.1 hypothetical protein AcV7_001965 [Antrodia cinnamomea]